MLFSDRNRLLKLTLIALMLAALSWYGSRYHPPLKSIQLYLGAPDRYHGETITIGPKRIISSDQDGFIVNVGNQRGTMPFKVRTQDPDILAQIKPGEQISLHGIFQRDSTLILKTFNINRGRDLKIVISIIPLLLIFVLLTRTYTIARYPKWRIILRS